MQTLLLEPESWDLMIDAAGNIAMASDPYSQAQDAASAIKTFKGECYYDTLIGVPYWAEILGKAPPMSYMRAKFIEAALTVPGVASAQCFFSSFVKRHLVGQVQITNTVDQTAVAAF